MLNVNLQHIKIQFLIFPGMVEKIKFCPSLSAAKGVNQVVTRFTPFFTPKNQGRVYFF